MLSNTDAIHSFVFILALEKADFADIKHQIDLKFINRYHHTWPKAIKLLSCGYIDLKKLMTHRFCLENAVDALTSSADRSSGAIKIHIGDGVD